MIVVTLSLALCVPCALSERLSDTLTSWLLSASPQAQEAGAGDEEESPSPAPPMWLMVMTMCASVMLALWIVLMELTEHLKEIVSAIARCITEAFIPWMLLPPFAGVGALLVLVMIVALLAEAYRTLGVLLAIYAVFATYWNWPLAGACLRWILTSPVTAYRRYRERQDLRADAERVRTSDAPLHVKREELAALKRAKRERSAARHIVDPSDL